MSTAAFSRPAAHPGADAENMNPQGHGGAPSAGAPQGAHVPGLDPGLAHPQLMSRPVFYVHAPPPPFMHYQWPMPFYNPFNPFSGMGYGMMMPPFPPVPYMDPPPYFLPHAPVQPVDPRRMVHPQPHPTGAPQPNLNQTRRPHPPHAARFRETVSTEVQTEPRGGEFQGGSPLRSCSDSGRETALNSPTSSTSSQKRSNGNADNYNAPKEGLQLRISSTRSGQEPRLSMPSPEGQSIQTIGKENVLVNSPSLKNRNVHLVRQESVTTVDSPAKEMSKKERRASVPDILLSWGNGMPQEDKMADDKNENLPSYEDDDVHFQSSTVVNEDQLEPEMVDGEKDENEKIAESKQRYEPFEHSLNISIKLCNAGYDTVDEQTLEEPSENAQTASDKLRRKLDESIWSVESLPVYVPTKEWLVQNMTAGPEVILESAEEAENAAQNDEPANERSRNSSTGSVQLSDSFIDFSTPASETNGKPASDVTCEPTKYNIPKCMIALDSPICEQSKLPEICAEEVERNDTSEPVQSPKRLSFTIEEKQEKIQESNIDKTTTTTTTIESDKAREEESLQKKVSEGMVEQLLAPPPVHAVTELSPSRGRLVDCGVQCPELQTTGMNRRPNFNTSDIHDTSTRSEGSGPTGNWHKKRHHPGRNKGPCES
ncbi:bucky ball [Eucyclogobius newberryi]|uniref:bucky ball n=1 Tax=Eucyclogobius newberryi TaxID=166745 RepID=UPI003B5C3AE8